jgi:mannosyltransferase
MRQHALLTTRPDRSGSESPGPRTSWRSPAVWLVAAIPGVLGFITGWYHVSVPPLWGDEGVTKAMAARSVSQLLATMPHDDVVHGAYYLVIHVVERTAGSGFADLRFPSVVAMAVAAAVTALIARRLAALAHAPVPDVTGAAAGVLFALLPGVIRYAQEARSYAIVTMLAAISTYLLVSAMTNGGGARRWTAYGVAAGLTGLFNIFGLFLLAAHALTLLAAGLARDTPTAPRARGRRIAGVPAAWLIAAATAVIALLPVIALAYTQRGALAWMGGPPSIPGAVVSLARSWAGSQQLTRLVFGLAAFGAVAGAVGSAVTRGHSERTLAVTPVSVALPWLVVPSAIVLVASQVHPLYDGRYMEYCTPALAILAAWGITWLARTLGAPLHRARLAWLGWLPAAAVFALLAAMLLPAGAKMRLPGSRPDNLQGDSRIVAANARPGDVVFFVPISYRPIEIEFPADWRDVRDIAEAESPMASDTLYGTDVSPAELIKRFTHVTRVWVYSAPGENEYLASARATPVDLLEARLVSRMKLVRRWHDGDKMLSLYQARGGSR